LDDRLGVLGLRNGNGLSVTIIPRRVKNVVEDGSLEPNGL
jgi:hypothetical protein